MCQKSRNGNMFRNVKLFFVNANKYTFICDLSFMFAPKYILEIYFFRKIGCISLKNFILDP